MQCLCVVMSARSDKHNAGPTPPSSHFSNDILGFPYFDNIFHYIFLYGKK